MRKKQQAYFVAQLTYNLQTLFAAVLLFIQSSWLIDVREGEKSLQIMGIIRIIPKLSI